MVTNRGLFERALRVIPGGVNSPVRSFRSVGGTPYFVARAEGPYVWDVEGRRYIDYVQGYGPGILGHAHPAVIEAVGKAVVDGSSYGAPTEREVLLAELLCERVPGMAWTRLTSSGTEAAMAAIRLARGVTGRNKIIKFAGCYHGHSDALLAAGGSGVANQGLPDSAGVTPGAVADTVVVPYNQVPEVDETVAVVVVEPVAANMGVVVPHPGFLQGLRSACDQAGALLLFDEVITGFRLAPGGATEWFGVVPDVWCFGKVVGGGLPIGVFGGKAQYMQYLAPLGEVYQAGTLSGNSLATAAGLATLEHLNSDAYVKLSATAVCLADAMTQAAADAGVECVVPRVGSLLGVFFGEQAPNNFDQAKAVANNGVYPRVFHALLEAGVAFAPGPFEALFPSLAHTEEHIDTTAEVFAQALRC
ncbi:MAG: glutamate-1-semialdehyde-2,1-aminomutase [Acidimicrobiia bacterium]|nr:glutamate-1-semialdehyde-2,1-aminomutase [Acidimicrobiia bacterium]MYC57686.1 glutamate-1-semialdehyde-2,1-aminomutase [Acidimicrobiia bacterium]